MATNDIPSALAIASFAVLAFAFHQLARIQMEAIGHLRGIAAIEARKVYYQDYCDGDGARFSWREIRDYCRGSGNVRRLRFWIVIEIGALGGLVGSIILDNALR